MMSLTATVKYVLRTNRQARENSAVLFAEVCRLKDIRLPEDIARAPKPETVGRLAHRVKAIYGWKE